MTDAHDAALQRARDILARPVPQREVPTRMHTPPPAEDGWQEWPPSRPTTTNMWTNIDRRIAARLDVAIDAIAFSLARRGKGVQEELAKRDAKIAQLERRISALEGDTVVDLGSRLKGYRIGGKDAAA